MYTTSSTTHSKKCWHVVQYNSIILENVKQLDAKKDLHYKENMLTKA